MEDIEGSESVSEASTSSQETPNESSKKDEVHEEAKKKEAEQANLKDSKGYLLFYTLVKLVIEISNIYFIKSYARLPRYVFMFRLQEFWS